MRHIQDVSFSANTRIRPGKSALADYVNLSPSSCKATLTAFKSAYNYWSACCSMQVDEKAPTRFIDQSVLLEVNVVQLNASIIERLPVVIVVAIGHLQAGSLTCLIHPQRLMIDMDNNSAEFFPNDLGF